MQFASSASGGCNSSLVTRSKRDSTSSTGDSTSACTDTDGELGDMRWQLTVDVCGIKFACVLSTQFNDFVRQVVKAFMSSFMVMFFRLLRRCDY